MSIVRALVCDQCNKRGYVPFDDRLKPRGPATLRKEAAREGWTCLDGRDLCPACNKGRKVDAYVDAYIASKEAR